MITSTLWKTLFIYPTLREKQAGNPREETTPFPYSSLPLFYPSFTITATIHFLVEFSHREACYYIMYILFVHFRLTITRKRIREEMIGPPLPPLLLYAVSPEAARAPNILFGRQRYLRRAIVGGAGNGVVCSMADLPLV